MTPEELNDLLRIRPFEAFRLCMTDGEVYEVRHPDALRVAGRTAVVFVRAKDGNLQYVYDRFDIISLPHIVRVELRQPATQGTNGA